MDVALITHIEKNCKVRLRYNKFFKSKTESRDMIVWGEKIRTLLERNGYISVSRQCSLPIEVLLSILLFSDSLQRILRARAEAPVFPHL
jgi:hypothetical protein